MSLIGVIAKNKDILEIKKDLQNRKIKIIRISKESIENLRNIKFDEIIFLENINLEKEEYKYMNEIIANTKFIIINGDIKIDILQQININKEVKIITIGFNSKSTITISSIKDGKIIVYIQRDIKKEDGEIIEIQEAISNSKSKKIYNHLAVFIISKLHNV